MPVSEDATVTSKGQVTIPKRIREQLELEAGTQVTFMLRGGEAVLLPKINDPLEQLEQLRDDIQFERKEIEQLRAESKEAWSRFQ